MVFKVVLKTPTQACGKSQAREYPASFVMYFIEGDGINFNYGIEYTEFAYVKLLRAQGAMELALYIRYRQSCQ